MHRKKGKEDKPETHEDLEGFDIRIDEFGNVQTTLSQSQINLFLNQNVEDKKFTPEIIKQLQERLRNADEEE